jgi:hypothetical protein
MPPPGVKMLSRWHAVGRHAGFAVAEASDAVPPQKGALEWNDLITMVPTSVEGDGQYSVGANAVLAQLRGRLEALERHVMPTSH